MKPPLAPDSLTTAALNAIVTGLERVDLAMRRLEAERLRLLGEAFELAAIESEEAPDRTRDDSAISWARCIERHTPVGTRGELALRAIRAEIATALHLGERTVDRHLGQAVAMTRGFPAVFAALDAGEISSRQATAIVDAGTIIGAADDAATLIRRGEYAEAVLSGASERTPAALAAHAKRIAERYAEAPLDERHAEARRGRSVWIEDGEDGMADLFARLPAVEAHAIKDRLTRIARAVARATRGAEADGRTDGHADGRSDEPVRSRDEIRADALCDLLLKGDSTAGGTGIRPIVQLIVPAATLSAPQGGRGEHKRRGEHDERGKHRAQDEHSAQGCEHDAVRLGHEPDSEFDERYAHPEPPELVGYGPVDAATAGRVAGSASHWERIHEDPRTGTVLSVDRYRPSEQMRRLLRARDQHCGFPGCRVPVHRCDIDHTVDAALGGPTATDNLRHLCRGHHTLKHQTGWRVEQEAAGELLWTSPTGRTHRTRPPRQEQRRADRPRPERLGQDPPPHDRTTSDSRSRVRFGSSSDGLPTDHRAGLETGSEYALPF